MYVHICSYTLNSTLSQCYFVYIFTINLFIYSDRSTRKTLNYFHSFSHLNPLFMVFARQVHAYLPFKGFRSNVNM